MASSYTQNLFSGFGAVAMPGSTPLSRVPGDAVAPAVSSVPAGTAVRHKPRRALPVARRPYRRSASAPPRITVSRKQRASRDIEADLLHGLSPGTQRLLRDHSASQKGRKARDADLLQSMSPDLRRRLRELEFLQTREELLKRLSPDTRLHLLKR